MQTRALGQSGIQASVVGLGTWAIGGWMWGGTDEAQAVAAIQAAIDEGITLVDTAPIYGFGVSEKIVGKAIEGRRDQVVLATKCGLVWHVEKGDHFFDSDERQAGGGDEYRVYKYLGADSIRYEIEQSLQRLKVDCIDLYQTHWQEPTTPIAETMEVLVKLKDEGKIRAIGVSNATPAQMDEYRAAGAVDSDQEHYSMLDREQEESNLPYCREHDIACLAYSPLAKGLLTGKMGLEREFAEGDLRNRNKRFDVENRRRVADLLDAFKPVAQKHDITLAQLAIAWTCHQPGCSHALIGARTPAQAQENAAAGRIGLDAEDLTTMREALAAHRDIV